MTCSICGHSERIVLGESVVCAGCGAFIEAHEVWKDIPEYHGSYRASSLGRIASMKRGTLHVMVPTSHRDGYPKLNLRLGDKSRTWHVHTLVALTFHGPRPAGLLIDHDNRQHYDNRASNLKYVTVAESNRNRSKPATSPRHSGTPCVYRDLTGGGYLARIKWGGKQVRLGRFTTIKDASKAVKEARRRYLAGQHIAFPLTGRLCSLSPNAADSCTILPNTAGGRNA